MKKLNKFEQRLLLGIATSVLITSVGFATPQKSLEARGIHTDASTAAKIVKSPELLKEVTEQAKPSGVDIKAYVETKEKAAKGTAPAAIVAAVKASGGAVANPAIVHLTGLPGAPGNAANPAPTAKQVALAVKLFALNPAFDFPDFEAAQDLVKGDAASGRAKIAVGALTLANVTAAKHIRTAAGLLAALPNAGHYTTQELEATDNLLRGVNGAAQDLNPNAPAIAGELVRIAALGHVGAPRLGVLGVGLTPENLVTGDLLHPLKNAFTLPEFNAAYYLLHGAAPGHATVGAVIGAPDLDQIQATEYLQTDAVGLGHAVIPAPTADQVKATVYLQKDPGGHLGVAAVPAPTLARIDALVGLGVGGVHTLAAIDIAVGGGGGGGVAHPGAVRLAAVLGHAGTPDQDLLAAQIHGLGNVGGVDFTNFTQAHFEAAEDLKTGDVGHGRAAIANLALITAPKIIAAEHLRTLPDFTGANHYSYNDLDITTSLMQGGAVAAPTAPQIKAVVSALAIHRNVASGVLKAIKTGFGAQPVGSIPAFVAEYDGQAAKNKFQKYILLWQRNAADGIWKQQRFYVWNGGARQYDETHADGVLNDIFFVEAAKGPKAKGEYFVGSGLTPDRKDDFTIDDAKKVMP